MADPLSIAASIITVVGAADNIGKVLSKLRTARNAPTEVLALQNEISDLRIVLEDVDLCSSDENRVEPDPASRRRFERLAILITHAQNQLCELDQILNHRLIKVDAVTGVSHVSRTGWLRIRGTVEGVRLNLRTARQDIALQLMSITS